jgi:hypothetical protein
MQKDQLLGLIIVYIETNKYKKASLAKRKGNVLFIVWLNAQTKKLGMIISSRKWKDRISNIILSYTLTY